VLVFDGARFPEIDPETARLIDQGAILVLNKADLGRAPAGASLDGRKLIPVSALLGDGIAELMEALSASAAALMPAGEGPVVTRARHRAALTEALEALRRGAGESIAELRGEELRVAATALSRLVGRIDVEDVLDGIFREFCIGK
jgi:tRNA modification GTPase